MSQQREVTGHRRGNTPPSFAKPMISTAPAANALANRIQAVRMLSGVFCAIAHCRLGSQYDKTGSAVVNGVPMQELPARRN
jgi:hypothetical protein